jgi:hypothetical protein
MVPFGLMTSAGVPLTSRMRMSPPSAINGRSGRP